MRVLTKYLTSPTGYVCLIGLATLICMAILQSFWHDAQSMTITARTMLQPLGFWAYYAYTIVASIGLCLLIPRQGISFIGGALFDVYIGSFLSIIACILTCSASVAFGRYLGRSWLLCHAPKPLQHLDTILCTKPIIAAMTLRLLPTGNNLIFSYLGGVSKAPAWAFILGSGLGYIPQNIFFSLLGAGFIIPSETMFVTTILITCLAALLAYYVYSHIKTRLRINNK